MNQHEADEYQKRFEEVRRISALWIESMQAAVAESVKIKEYAAQIKKDPASWHPYRDDVDTMLDDMSALELAMVKIAIAKIKKERKQCSARQARPVETLDRWNPVGSQGLNSASTMRR